MEELIKLHAEIIKGIAIKFAHYYFKERFNEDIHSKLKTDNELFEEFEKGFKTKKL